MAEPPDSLRDGRYAMIRVLGEGAQTTTYEAVDKRGGRLVAIRCFRVRRAKSWKERREGRKEARAARREAKALARAERHARRASGGWLPKLLSVLLILGLTMAQVVVTVLFRVVAPLFLGVLSVVFGKGFVRMAESMADAAKKTAEGLGKARDTVRGWEDGVPPRMRVAAQDEAPRRVRVEAKDGGGEADAEAEAFADEEAGKGKRAKRG